MKIHILGICGTFMGGIALLAREQGHHVTGADSNVYPPMSTMLAEQGVDIMQGFQPHDIPPDTDTLVVGNVMRRGLDIVEHVLDRNLPYTSGPQWLGEHILRDRWVLAVAGTHGKTTTASMLAWILEYAGLQPGFLIGGVPENFGISARLGASPFFVVEADEYDTAFFDKRSKFVHYHPRTVILNNLEYDHADIFPDVQAIKTQFHHLMRTVPSSGLAVVNAQEANLKDTLAMGCWTPVETFADGDWRAEYLQADGSAFRVFCKGVEQGIVRWDLLGEHNVNNALAAIAAARHAGVPAEHAIAGLAEFQGVKRRMQVRGTVRGVTVYDDFAHHPTAITTTLAGLRAKVGKARIIALLEPRSNTMRMGTHGAAVAAALQVADYAFIYQLPEWDDIDVLVATVAQLAQAGDHVLVMSNGGFGGVHDKLLAQLAN
ncbi:UDP-N-acetylmuramate:L-alanyl-gamma-D-glutamyl-meso-diaminopimelate ligase [Thiothrix fructosivorans]|uniref:UDP-N-acetylmuramate--L-alanyl-gamma-D-glutamyl-meso-2,6-diaminoheptandioate ligase n=1 Tax=Thiothrix fructosivorans TaxID=111770 RepID=A0A8B0SI24_9GAMM|nr:UDP-N-acetylmuramate:L-alanyl-gamma-D-glutamyl-meso-diaminopimelate ligase [Thiothrix fructosivorans]MBO0614602.1 UDP-N-acetylmuramate:L-alanyl-gamma-D-glutamyl-meso-diaminopimelate ligase [Thiothrix fructosivorans]QTX09427.1 UDP-N-acetylmuramate:L-alanyl-gamma-D-glutamyl-meso-diaminopimelate ligase [Thiothrix fructosivorans]